MSKVSSSGLIVAILFLTGCNEQANNPLENAPPYPIQDTVLHKVVSEYCIDCHNPIDKKGKLDLQSKLDGHLNDYPFVWHEVSLALANNEMPPKDKDGVKRPDQETYQRVSAWLNERFNHKPEGKN
ncbi:c-type cytochrome domain-containing protein [Catenovulum maritimum]|uniref:Cytochrome C Planctomycete-type domain-containing protein n=1 Tax=Catenovulum maritimum TaxID=1513271 RepID=A0A0J8GZQ8_9ALTE|nr:c-type cytochrome domain-containing protein [Catenovulum maritimum]KMT66228.1 hypothetical protein XM47_04315 [Catenovulum maritimum]